jgi:hypothetical protein
VVAGLFAGETAKRGAKFKGINNPMIPWGVSIGVALIFAWDLYNPAWALSKLLASLLIGMSPPVIHHLFMALLKSNEKTAGLAKLLAGETKNVNKDSVKISKEVDETTGKEVYVVRAKDEETGEDMTLLRKNDATILVDKTEPKSDEPEGK